MEGLGFRQNNCFTEMCSGSEAGSYLRLIDFVYHSTLGLRVIKKRDEKVSSVRVVRHYSEVILLYFSAFPSVINLLEGL